MRIVLTGATGFLGLRLLAEFLERGDEITVLVRTSPERALARLGRGLRALDRPTSGVQEALARVTACRVDLASEWLGLGVTRFRELADWAQAVWHSAGQISLSGDAAKCAVNVEGTMRVLQLAAAGRRRPAMHHVSTAFVAGMVREGVVLESDLEHDRGFANAYEESKYQAELLVREWSRVTGLPAAVYRPTVLVSDQSSNPDLPIHPLATMTMLFEQVFGQRDAGRPVERLRFFGSPEGWQNMLQVEHAAATMARLSEAAPPTEGVNVFHLAHPRETPIRRVVEMLESVVPVEVTMAEQGEPWSPPGQPELSGFLPYFAHRRRYDAGNVRSAGIEVDPPEVTTEYLSRAVLWADESDRV